MGSHGPGEEILYPSSHGRMKATCWTRDSSGGRLGRSVRRSGAVGSRVSGTWPDGFGTTPEIGVSWISVESWRWRQCHHLQLYTLTRLGSSSAHRGSLFVCLVICANKLFVCLRFLETYRFPVCLSYLHPGLTETKFLTEFLPHEGVWVVSLVKQTLQGT